MIDARRMRHWAAEAGVGLAALAVIAAFALAVLPPLTRPQYERWGATDAEVIEPLPGDDLVSRPDAGSTTAITIEAPAVIVYSLVVQMGHERAGWYGWDWAYRLTGSAGFVDGGSSRRIVPELQGLGVGDRVYVSKGVGYDVIQMDRPTVLLLFGGLTPDGRTVAGDSQEAGGRTSWVWVVRPIDGDTTRLVVRMRSSGASRGALADWAHRNPLDFGRAMLGRRTLVGLRGVAEDLAEQR